MEDVKLEEKKEGEGSGGSDGGGEERKMRRELKKTEEVETREFLDCKVVCMRTKGLHSQVVVCLHMVEFASTCSCISFYHWKIGRGIADIGMNDVYLCERMCINI